MRVSDWSSDVCSSDLRGPRPLLCWLCRDPSAGVWKGDHDNRVVWIPCVLNGRDRDLCTAIAPEGRTGSATYSRYRACIAGDVCPCPVAVDHPHPLRSPFAGSGHGPRVHCRRIDDIACASRAGSEALRGGKWGCSTLWISWL